MTESTACSLAKRTVAPDLELVYESGIVGADSDRLPGVWRGMRDRTQRQKCVHHRESKPPEFCRPARLRDQPGSHPAPTRSWRWSRPGCDPVGDLSLRRGGDDSRFLASGSPVAAAEAATGWKDLAVSDTIVATKAPDDSELEMLRALDPERMYLG
ncbi:MAG: hypothetical protein OEM39_05880 [Acidimicrobiia bacterium]|nr:hypothetical protein [Acidimicrobiia bacterium]